MVRRYEMRLPGAVTRRALEGQIAVTEQLAGGRSARSSSDRTGFRATRCRMSRRAVASVIFAVAFCACAASFASVRQDAVDLVSDVSACSATDTCVMMPGFDRDCTGILGCAFPVRAGREAETTSRGNDVVERSRSTGTCAVAFCFSVPSDTATCDLDAGRCVVVARPR